MVAWIWILIPLAGIVLAGFSEWLKFKKENAQLSSSNQVMQSDMAALTDQLETLRMVNEQLVERVQNLEAIVTSETWDLMNREAGETAASPPLLDLNEPEAPSEQDRAARMARRLRNS